MKIETSPGNPEELTITLEDGRKIYWPKGDISRLAPQAICAVAGRIVKLREILVKHEMPKQLRHELELLAKEIPFEKSLLSGKMEEIDAAIRKLGLF